MALQNFYSRVPAKVSMFNKADSYDTFICSDTLTREFIEKELSIINEFKQTKDELMLIRQGKLPTVYAQYITKSEVLIQSTISFLPLDFTKERSSYLVHSLIFNDNEKTSVIKQIDNDLFNIDNFETDIDKFQITKPDAGALKDYPEKEIIQKKYTPFDFSIFNMETLKRFIYGVLYTLTSKGKSIYFTLQDNDNLPVKLINAIYQIIPYKLREEFTFITYLGDITNHQSFKIKCYNPNLQINENKGIKIDFIKNICTGIKEEEYETNKDVIEFFYMLLTNEIERNDFLRYMDFNISNYSLKTLNEIVFLFKCSSNYYKENKILFNDDKVLEYITIYEKYEEYLIDEYKINGIKCLNRYSNTPIPKNIFTKISKIYPKQKSAIKHIIMSVILELVHYDLMRDKLFIFMKNNYEDEETETKETITKDLASVFYGGFLQTQILSFFTLYFEKMNDNEREVIIEKLLLAIRTKSIQNEILEFLDTFYYLFNDKMKNNFYNSVIEHLPEGDDLTKNLLVIASKYIDELNEKNQLLFFNQVMSFINNEQKVDKHPVLEILSQLPSLYQNANKLINMFITKLFSSLNKKKIFNEYIEYVYQNYVDLEDLFNRFKLIANLNQNISYDLIIKYMSIIKRTLEKSNLSIYELINYDEKISTFALSKVTTDKALSNDTIDNKILDNTLLYQDRYVLAFSSLVIKPLVIDKLYDIFDYKRKGYDKDKEHLINYINSHEQIKKSEKYQLLNCYFEYYNAFLNNDVTAMVKNLLMIPNDKEVRTKISDYIKYDILNNQSVMKDDLEASTLLITQSISYLQTNVFELKILYDFENEQTNKNRKEYIHMLITSIIKITYELFVNKISVNNLNYVFSDYQNTYKRKASKHLNDLILDYQFNNEFYEMLLEEKKNSEQKKFFHLFFRKAGGKYEK